MLADLDAPLGVLYMLEPVRYPACLPFHDFADTNPVKEALWRGIQSIPLQSHHGLV